MLDPVSGRANVRMVDITAQPYQIAPRYLIRLSDEDCKDPVALSRNAILAGLLPEAFRSRFQSVGLNVKRIQLKGRAT
jgi:hypothetical protein